MQAGNAVDRLTDDIYETILEPSRWSQVLLQLGEALSSPMASLVLRDSRSPLVFFAALHPEAPPEAFSDWAAYYSERDQIAAAGAIAPEGALTADDELLAETSLAHSEVYNDFYLRHGWGRFVGVCATKRPDETAILAFHRPRKTAPFDAREKQLLERLVPHMRRALRVARRVGTLTDLQRGSLEAWEELPHGVILVEHSGRVLFANRESRRLLSQGDGLTVSNGRLASPDPAADSALRANLRSSTRGDSDNPHRGGCLAIPRTRTGTRLIVNVSPIQLESLLAGARGPSAIVLVADPDAGAATPSEVLQRSFRLTAAESSLALQLCDGKTLAEIAIARGVSKNTVRTQLQAVLTKTGAKRQIDLVRLLVSEPLVLPRG